MQNSLFDPAFINNPNTLLFLIFINKTNTLDFLFFIKMANSLVIQIFNNSYGNTLREYIFINNYVSLDCDIFIYS